MVLMPRIKKSETPKPKTKSRSNQPRKLPKRGSYKRAESPSFLPLNAGEGKSRSNQPRTTKEKVAMEGGYRMKWRKIKDTPGLKKNAR